MKSLTTIDFWRAKKAYRIWQENQQHPSLHFKKVGKNLWSARVTDDYYWFWIGSHNEYDALLN
ncbi:hypothetical protein [Dulcicalothrix desertica]|uniref:hypothetical protein n=1 Tax=Dulcicalothrix desertica TaxID=32056 RepID=UPI000F8D63DD|nr:hypothetical protein [Dulcicalothrix desertica]TWH39740.1 hypothetical protein CAL7102_08998 [Dulcicalothrix desertica PCC 7102]